MAYQLIITTNGTESLRRKDATAPGPSHARRSQPWSLTREDEP